MSQGDGDQHPTQTQLTRAQLRGQFAISREFISASIWLGGVAVLATVGPMVWKTLQQVASQSWSAASIDAEGIASQPMFGTIRLLQGQLLIIFAVIILIALLVQLSQTRLQLLPRLAMPDISRLSPIRNLSRLFSAEHFWAIALGMVKFALLFAVAIWVVATEVSTVIRIGERPLATAAGDAAEWLLFVSLKLAVACVAVGMIDYAIQWWLNFRRLRMTDDQIREEQRITEPAPEVEAHRRLLSQQMRQQRQDLARRINEES